MAQSSVSTSEQLSLQNHLGELDPAIVQQQERLDQLKVKGEGWVATSVAEVDQASSLGWPDTPEGCTWVAGTDQPSIEISFAVSSTRQSSWMTEGEKGGAHRAICDALTKGALVMMGNAETLENIEWDALSLVLCFVDGRKRSNGYVYKGDEYRGWTTRNINFIRKMEDLR